MNYESLKHKKIIYYLAKKIIRFVRKLLRLPHLYYLKPKVHREILRVGFIVQLPAIWDKQIDVYNELITRDNVEVFIFAVPQYNWDSGKPEGEVDSFFKDLYPDLIDVSKMKNIIEEFKGYKIDYLFYPRPYDHYLPTELRSETLYKFVSCCYIPYGMSGSDVFNDTNIYSPFFDNMSIIYMDSPAQYELMKNRYRISCLFGKKKVLYLGYPVLYKYLSDSYKQNETCITWTPRWSVDPKIGFSSFLDYAEDFLEFVKNINCACVFRPHPLMFDELIEKKIITLEYKEYYLKQLSKYDVLYDIKTPIDEIIKNTSILITDYSSIIAQYFLTGKPMIYCDKGMKLNRTFKEMIELNYIASNKNDLKKYLTNLMNDKDFRKDSRNKYIQNNFSNMNNPSVNIVNDLIG